MVRTVGEVFGVKDGKGLTILPKHLGFEGQLAVSWAAAGGVLFGGFAVAVLTLMGRLSGAALFLTAGGLFMIGSAFGFVHGVVLGYLGRDPDKDRSEVIGDLARAVLYSVPVLAVAWAVTGWIAMTVVALYVDNPLAFFGVGVGWLLGLVVLVVALGYGARGFQQAFARWPDRVAGTLLVGASFVALVATFLFDRPDIWWSAVGPELPAPVIVAGGVTVWLLGPVVTLSLWMARTLPGEPRKGVAGTFARGAVGVAGGTVVGLALGVVANLAYSSYGVLPLALWSGRVGEMAAVALGQAFLDEILLRLFVVTLVVWAFHRWRGGYGMGAVATAVLLAALLHVALYIPGLTAIGFPGTGSAVGYGAVAIFLPALAYGAVYWWRGLLAAVAAHAATVVAAALMMG